ncbi:MAG: hypothetical protein KAU17_00550, partial [Spirochaetales bacterium]|nr:hypothetical protein [Spirochaetales bacterium]
IIYLGCTIIIDAGKKVNAGGFLYLVRQRQLMSAGIHLIVISMMELFCFLQNQTGRWNLLEGQAYLLRKTGV